MNTLPPIPIGLYNHLNNYSEQFVVISVVATYHNNTTMNLKLAMLVDGCIYYGL